MKQMKKPPLCLEFGPDAKEDIFLPTMGKFHQYDDQIHADRC